MSRTILALNAGSSSIKFGLYACDGEEPARVGGGKLEGIGTAPRATVRDATGAKLGERQWPGGAGLSHEQLFDEFYSWAAGCLPEQEIAAVGHRVVHGGAKFTASVEIDACVLAGLDALSPLAPLHQPHNLATIRAMTRLEPELPQVACFDTAFHATMPAPATMIALPRALSERGIRRYGFHGLSYEYVARRLAEVDPALAAGRTIVAHLGNGASLCALHAGRSIDTTMGFTALDGLVMGTRSGSLDPGVILYLMQHEGMSVDSVAELLYHRSGLLGVSGVSSDMRALHASSDPNAALAIELFIWRVARETGALLATLGGLDGIVFTAGIGENDASVRAAICARLGWTGIALDPVANEANAPLISASGSKITVRVMPTDEEAMIARHTFELVR